MNLFKRAVVFYLFILIVTASVCACQASGDTIYYGAESEGKICGYGELTISTTMKDEKEVTVLEENIQLRISALGADVDSAVHQIAHIDPATGKYFYYTIDIDQGSVKIGATVEIDGDVAHITMRPEGKKKDIALPFDVVLDNGQFYPLLVEDFVKNENVTKIYKVLNTLDGEVQEVRFTKKGIEELELAGNKYNAVVLDELNLRTGVKLTRWVNIENAHILKVKHPVRTIFLADRSIRNKLERVAVDNHLFAKVDASISDVRSISYMKVRASIEPTGSWITPESLNVSGQKFEGSVKENTIKGIFEISHPRYDGADAPPFPPDFSKDEMLAKYLESEDFIESDDPVLIGKAKEITKGAANAWEAAKRLGEWVGNEISYDIPGGGTARNTYDLKEGECGGHSRLLAAFCRAVGIPARVVWGCMYVPSFGGAFGQHAWNEIYMGKAGWIPVDSTAKETDFADSGHIRLGELHSKSIGFLPEKMEILDYQAGSQKMGLEVATEIPDLYKPYLGSYKSPNGAFRILFQNGNLAVDIPGKMAFDLNEPDEEGWWVFKATNTAAISFERDEKGNVTSMTLLSKTRLPRREGLETVADDVPEKFRAYLGKYPVPMQNMDLIVIFKDGNLAVDDPNRGIVKLKGPNEKGLWIDQYDKNRISFDTDDSGNVTGMIFHQILPFPRE